jgi:hypothetical protein
MWINNRNKKVLMLNKNKIRRFRCVNKPVAEPEFFKRWGKLLTNTILYRYALEINSKHI